jgi:hypothetical protein
MVRRKAVEWFNDKDGLEDNSPMNTNKSGDVYQSDTVGPK